MLIDFAYVKKIIVHFRKMKTKLISKILYIINSNIYFEISDL